MAILPPRSFFVVVVLPSLFFFVEFSFALSDDGAEQFTEELLLKPLPDRKVLAHFYFETRAPRSSSTGVRHHHLFPKAIQQLVVPWYVKLYYHTIRVYVDGERVGALNTVLGPLRVSPSEDRVSPGVMRFTLRLPCDVVSASLVIDFDKGFLHVSECPPDASGGFDIPSAIVSFPDVRTSALFRDDNASNRSPLLSVLQESRVVRCYTEVLLVPLATPDFSMPYNVITITCTVLALYFGSMLNALRRRPGEEERTPQSEVVKKWSSLGEWILRPFSRGREEKLASSPSSSSFSLIPRGRMLFKIILVAVVAVLWHYLSSL